MKDLSEIEKKLKIRFKNKDLLLQAFVHRSYLNEHPQFRLNHNERLEFLGDAVLELVVTEYLFQNYQEPEGEMTRWRAALVNSQSLSDLGFDLGFDQYLLLSEGEKNGSQKARRCILADAVEAFIGALYLDQGIEEVKRFVKKYLIIKLPQIIEKGLYQNYKSLFQEKAQEIMKITPTYQVLKEWGPDHSKQFLIGAFLGDRLIAEGQGSSKQEAEQEAARRALEKKGWK